MENDVSQSGSQGGLPLYQEPEFQKRELLVARAHAELVTHELRELETGLSVEKVREQGGIVRLEMSTASGSQLTIDEAIDRVRANCAAKFDGFEPVLSPVHIVTVGQPNVRGNGEDALPQNQDEGLPERASGEGEGVVVAVIDTGIELHDWLNGAYVARPSDFEREVTVKLEDGKEVLGEQAGHGNFLAGLVLRQAPGATIRVFRTSNPNGLADIDEVAEAIKRSAAAEADVVNLSLGCFTRYNQAPWTLVEALGELPATTTVVASAGNSSTSRSFWPGALASVTAVGALKPHEGGWKLAGYTNQGPWVDAYIPATHVLSTFIHYDGPALYRDKDGQPAHKPVTYSGWATWSGTSMAAATWSGALARAVGTLGVSPAEAAQILLGEPERLDFVRKLDLPPDERLEYRTNLQRRALDFVPPGERAAA